MFMQLLIAWKYMKQKVIELSGKTDKSTITGDFNIHLWIGNRKNRKKISKDREHLNNKFDLINIYRTPH